LRRGVSASWGGSGNSAHQENFMLEGLLQPTHLLVILAVAVFVMGPKKLPELGKGLAEGIRSFQKGVKEATEPEKTEKS
jgi:sec-independent protein translocase protein TatA